MAIRGSPAKGVGVLKRARVQIPPSPPKHKKPATITVAGFFVLITVHPA